MKNKVLLIGLTNSGSNNIGLARLYFPMGLAYISAVLKKNGYDCDCLDLQTEAILDDNYDVMHYIKCLNFNRYDIVAFGGTFLDFGELKFISNAIRQIKADLFQIAGGNMATIISDIILMNTSVNCVVIKEGEETIVDLVSCFRNKKDWKKINGIKFFDSQNKKVVYNLRDKIVDLDNLPFPDRDGWAFDAIHKKTFPFGTPGEYSAAIFGSRGCPFSCIFCNPLSGKKVRVRSAKSIVQEIIHVQEKYNVKYFRFFDEVFMGGKKKSIQEFCELLIRERIKVYWWCQLQVRLVDKSILKLMKEAGCLQIGYGVESGSNKILEEMNKGITVEIAEEVIRATESAGICPAINFVAGMPSENIDTIKASRDFIKRLNDIKWVNFPWIGFVVPIPGTELYDIAKDKGIIKDEVDYLTNYMTRFVKRRDSVNLTKMTKMEFQTIVTLCNKEALQDFYQKHPLKKFFSILGIDHNIRWDIVFKSISLKKIKPFLATLLWAFIGKRDNRLGQIIGSVLYNRSKIQRPFDYELLKK